MIAVIDYGVGNLFSLGCSLKYLGFDCRITSSPEDLRRADKIILPGVGAFGDAMDKLSASGAMGELMSQARSGKPVMGICLGMQMLFERSREYGEHDGLGLLKGEICPLADDLHDAGLALKVPHMGWNSLRFVRRGTPFDKWVNEGGFVYYVHSFYAKNCENSLAAGSDYGVFVPGAVCRDNIIGCQFHPEKSGAVGLGILKGFCEL